MLLAGIQTILSSLGGGRRDMIVDFFLILNYNKISNRLWRTDRKNDKAFSNY